MANKRSESFSPGEEEIELPEPLVDYIELLKEDQTKLLKDKAFANGDQLRKFLANVMVERMITFVEMAGTSMLDTHMLAVSNTKQLRGMRRWTAEHLRGLGVKVSDGEPFPGVGTDEINEFGDAFHALGSYLQEKYPDDEECQKHHNKLVEAFQRLIMALNGNQSVPDAEEEEPESAEGGDPTEVPEMDAEGDGGTEDKT